MQLCDTGHRESVMITLQDLDRIAGDATNEPGEALSAVDLMLIRVGVAASVTSLDRDAIEKAVADAFAAGATAAQIQEIISLVAGLGVHSLMATSVMIVDQARRAGAALAEELTPEQQALWDENVGDDPFWQGFEVELPGFLRAMLVLSPDQFAAFFEFCAVPWKSRQVRAKIKELTAMACDATPAIVSCPAFGFTCAMPSRWARDVWRSGRRCKLRLSRPGTGA